MPKFIVTFKDKGRRNSHVSHYESVVKAPNRKIAQQKFAKQLKAGGWTTENRQLPGAKSGLKRHRITRVP